MDAHLRPAYTIPAMTERDSGLHRTENEMLYTCRSAIERSAEAGAVTVALLLCWAPTASAQPAPGPEQAQEASEVPPETPAAPPVETATETPVADEPAAAEAAASGAPATTDDAPADGAAAATSPTKGKVDPAEEANNPLSNLTSFSFQDNAYLRHAGVTDANRSARLTNTGWLRVAKSFGSRVLARASLPVQSRDDGAVSGLGDLNIILPIIVSRPGASTTIGVGPAAQFPTHTDDRIGTNAYGVGGAFTFFWLGSKVLQVGSLVTFNQNVKPDLDPQAEQSLLTYQPFLFWQLGQGYYLRSSGTMSFEIQNNVHNLPVGIGAGKILPVAGKVIFNLYVELQQSVWSKGPLQPTTQVFLGINTQLVPKH